MLCFKLIILNAFSFNYSFPFIYFHLRMQIFISLFAIFSVLFFSGFYFVGAIEIERGLAISRWLLAKMSLHRNGNGAVLLDSYNLTNRRSIKNDNSDL